MMLTMRNKRARIEAVIFFGDKKIKDKKTSISVITSEESKFWKFISKNTYLDNQELI